MKLDELPDDVLQLISHYLLFEEDEDVDATSLVRFRLASKKLSTLGDPLPRSNTEPREEVSILHTKYKGKHSRLIESIDYQLFIKAEFELHTNMLPLAHANVRTLFVLHSHGMFGQVMKETFGNIHTLVIHHLLFPTGTTYPAATLNLLYQQHSRSDEMFEALRAEQGSHVLDIFEWMPQVQRVDLSGLCGVSVIRGLSKCPQLRSFSCETVAMYMSLQEKFTTFLDELPRCKSLSHCRLRNLQVLKSECKRLVEWQRRTCLDVEFIHVMSVE